MNEVVPIPLLPKGYAYYPSRVTEARHARGFSERELALALKIPPETLSDIEDGYMSLTAAQMVELLKITDCPLAFFANPPRPIKPGSIGPIFFCKPPEALND